MRDENIHIGDVLRIRQWDDMADEFGVDSYGDIPCSSVFTKHMKSLCGKQFTVFSVNKELGIYCSDERVEWDGRYHVMWKITADMLEPLEEDFLEDITDEELIKLLFE